jgi:hypothetical protein
VTPPEGMKDKLLMKAILEYIEEPGLTPVERFVFEKPLRTACIFAITISGTFWAILGNNFAKLLSSILG